MRRQVTLLLVSGLLWVVPGCDPGGRVNLRDSGAGDTGSSSEDSDGDGISDDDEGRATSRDTDADGTPDWEDADSDGDGILDSVEAGDSNPATPPVDSDGDSNPDFIDLDADDNGIPDAMETDGDVDGDGTANFADTDDDNDGVSDAQEIRNGGLTADGDSDGLVDYQDPDSDNDTISDGHERDADTDEDGLFDSADLDSDDDGLPDSTEAGDADLGTAPIDSDMDGIANFRDPDSDNDGLSDGDEVLIHMTDPTLEDSDGDGVSDLIEIGAGTDPRDSTDDPRARGDFVFVVPYMEPPTPERDTLTFRTNIQFADVYFLFDTTTSMRGEIVAMRTAVLSVVQNITCEVTGTSCLGDSDCSGVMTPGGATTVCGVSGSCIEDPGLSSCIASVFTGTGVYEGNPDSYDDLLSLQAVATVTQAAIPSSADGGGAGEALFESVACVANPSICSEGARRSCAAGADVGTPCYRNDAVRILVAITDEQDECSACASDNAALAGGHLLASDITFVGIDADSGHEPRTDLRAIATQSGSFRADGTTPLVFDGDGTAVADAVTDAINEIVEGVPLRVTIEATDEPGDDGDSIQFIQALETNTTAVGCSAIATEDANPAGDGIHDTFPAVTPGTPVCWDVIPNMNTTVMPATTPLVYRARLTVSGDGSPLDSRLVFFLVPPEIPEPGGPD